MGKLLHGYIDADGGCLFSALSYALSESQSLSQFYRSYALKYISDNPADFADDIYTMTKMTVPDYITYMTPHIRFGDQIVLIALCLSLEVSITLYQKGDSLIDVCNFAPRTGNFTKNAELYLDLCGYHYDCVLAVVQVPSHQVSHYSQDLSATSNADSSVEFFEKLLKCPVILLFSLLAMKSLKILGKLRNLLIISTPDSLLPLLLMVLLLLLPKKGKVDLPHTREHGGKTYLLSDYGLKSFEKLLENKQLDRGVNSKKCLQCEECMDWRNDGPIARQKGVYYYQPRHNGKCIKNGVNDISLAYDKELKQIDSKLIVLNSKKVKSNADLKQISDLSARRTICFEKGIAGKSKKAAADARARGNCPGYKDGGCPTKSPQIPGKSYCSPCQAKVNANNNAPEQHARVVRCQENAALEEKNITVLVPIVVSLQSVDIRAILPDEIVDMLRDLHQFVGCDSENKKRGNTTAELTYEWVFRDFSTGSTLHLKRFHKQWNISLDSSPKKLVSDAEAKQAVFKFVGKKTLMYSATSEGCDKKRLMNWVGFKDLFKKNYNDKALSFNWFNLGAQVCYKIVGPDGAIITPTMKLLTLYHHLYEVPGTDVSVPTPPAYVPCGPLTEKCKNDVIQMYNIAQALSLSIHYHDAS